MVQKNLISVRLRARIEEGIDPKTGGPLLRYRNFNNVKSEAEPSPMLDVMSSIMNLQKHPFVDLEVLDTSLLERV